MAGSITLHPKLGVNPRLMESQCPICLKVHNPGVLLMGIGNRVDVCSVCGAHVYGGISMIHPCPKCTARSYASRRELSDYERVPCPSEPCNECKDFMKQGIILYSVKEDDQAMHTGCMAVVKEEAVNRMFEGDEILPQILKKRACAISDGAWDKLGLPRENVDNRKAVDECKHTS